MQNNILLFILFLSINTVFTQDNKYSEEMRIYVINGSQNIDYGFHLTKLSKAYRYSSQYVPNETIGECCLNCPYNCNGGEEEGGISSGGYGGYGFSAAHPFTATPYYGYSVYLLRNIESGNVLYIDTRDDRYTREFKPLIEGYHDDFGIRYDVLNGTFDWDPTGIENWLSIPQGGVVQIWKGNGFNIPRVEDFPSDYWENSLGLFDVGEQDEWFEGENPTIFWGKEKDSYNITKYRLYRAFSPDGSAPSS